MYGTLVTDDTYKRADGIYKSISDVFNPNLKEFITQGKIHDKNLVEEAKSNKTCQSVAMKTGIAATVSPGCKDVGKCIMDIADTMQEVIKARDNWLNKFRNDVLYTMERRCEQDGKYVNGLRKKFQDDFKAKSNETEKAMAGVMKLKKRSLSKPSSRKMDEKLQKANSKLHSAKTATELIAHEMLSRAFSEERRRYCFFVEKQCEMVQAMIEYHETALRALQPNLDSWMEMAASHGDLLPGAIALIESTLPQQSNPALDELDTTLRISHSGSSSEFANDYDPPRSGNELSPMGSVTSWKNFGDKSPSGVKKIDAYNNPYRAASSIGIRSSEMESSDVTDGGVFQDEDIGSEVEKLPGYSFINKNTELGKIRIASASDEPFVSNIIRRRAYGGSSMANKSRKSYPDGRSLNDSAIDVNWNSEVDEADAVKQQERRALPPLSVKSPDSQRSPASSRSSTKTEDHESDTCASWYESLYDYNPEKNSNKLTLRRGDKIIIYDGESKGGWIYGENKRTKQKGWFPQNYGEKKYRHSELTSPGTPSGRDEPWTPPTSPAFDTSLTKSPPGSMFETNRLSFGSSNRDEDSRPTSTCSADGISRMNGKKRLSGRNVFQFAKDIEKPFEEIRLRKTGQPPLH